MAIYEYSCAVCGKRFRVPPSGPTTTALERAICPAHRLKPQGGPMIRYNSFEGGDIGVWIGEGVRATTEGNRFRGVRQAILNEGRVTSRRDRFE